MSQSSFTNTGRQRVIAGIWPRFPSASSSKGDDKSHQPPPPPRPFLSSRPLHLQPQATTPSTPALPNANPMNAFGRVGRSKSAREARPTPVAPAAPRTPPPSTDPSLSSRTDRLQERLAAHDRELLRLRGQLRATKKETRQHRFYAKRAARVLQQKKALEKRLAAAMDMRYNLTIAQDEAEATVQLSRLQPRRTHAGEMARTADLLRDLNHPAPGEVEDVLDDVQERMREIQEVTQMLGSEDFLNEGGVDDAELEEELMREMADFEATEGHAGGNEDASFVSNDDYMKRIDDLMPSPHQAEPHPYRPPPASQEPRAKSSRQQRPARRGGH